MSNIQSPLNAFFDVEQSEFIDNYQITEQPKNEIAQIEKDEDDIQIDNNFNEIYNAAITTFNNQMGMVEIMEPRYAARNAEVAANFLALALQANAAKAKVKTDRSRSKNVPNKITNNTIVSTREEILRMISVDAETKEV